ncbi:MAG: family 20 glycosylhydrolase, partial [Clostridiaceae bacterium]|nr:family 20 glycosylhydrolase [Clostridiaceae bacterium]
MRRLIASMILFFVSLSIFVPIRYVLKLDERIDMESQCYSIPNVQKLSYIESGLAYKFTPFCDVVLDKKYEKQLREKAKVFAEDLELLCGYYIQAAPGTHPGKGNIFLTLDCDRDDIGEEGYVIEVRKNYIKICGNSEKGVFWGTRTLLQWLKQGHVIKELTVVDYPAYKERSSMIDVARKYFSVEYIKNHIRELSYLKYNYLYLHLTDNEAFRIECETYPEIVSDKHYTKKEIKEIIEFAKRYNITVIPEIEMPGHMASVTKVYPEWQLEDKNGNYNHTRIDLTNPEVYEFVENLLNEFVPMFEGEYFHIGADEYIP